jgi:hypothetical protein
MAPRFIENGAGQRGSARKSETRLAESPRDLQVNADLRGPVRKADDGSRTRDLRLGKPTLYRLSYVRGGAEPSAVPSLGRGGLRSKGGAPSTLRMAP